MIELLKVFYCSFSDISNILTRNPGLVPKAVASDSRVSNDIRYDRLHHYVVSIPDSKRRRDDENCNNRGRTMCYKCNIGLCIDCFRSSHTQ